MGNKFDSVNYPTTEPLEVVAGDRWAWKRTDLDGDYDNASYTLKYSARLEGTGATEIEITATASGDDYLVEVAAATTAAYTVGTYQWQAYIIRDSDSERVTVDYGSWVITANRDAATTDPRTHAKIVLKAIEAVIESRATKDQESYSINGRTLQRTPMADLLVLRKQYKWEVQQEEAAERISNGLGHSGRVLVRF